jgi:hypothetical protein
MKQWTQYFGSVFGEQRDRERLAIISPPSKGEKPAFQNLPHMQGAFPKVARATAEGRSAGKYRGWETTDCLRACCG